MNVNTLTTQDHLRGTDYASSSKSTTTDIAEFLLLEQCAQRCETLADQLAATALHHPLMLQLSDCLAACDTYLAAKARESHREDQLALLCMDALIDTAVACAGFDSDTARRCRKTCRVCQQFIGRRRNRPVMLAS